MEVATLKELLKAEKDRHHRASLVPRPFSNFFHTHAQQRGRGRKEGSGDTAYPSADPGM